MTANPPDMNIDSGSVQFALEQWDTLKGSDENNPQAYLKVIKNEDGQLVLEAVGKEQLGFLGSLMARFHLGGFSLTKIVEVVENTFSSPTTSHIPVICALTSLQTHLDLVSRKKSEKENLAIRILKIMPLISPYHLPDGFVWPQGAYEFATALVQNEESLKSLMFCQSEYENKFLTKDPDAHQTQQILTDAISLKKQDPLLSDAEHRRQSEELGNRLGENLQRIVGRLTPSQGLQALSTMFNVKIKIVNSEGVEKHTIVPQKAKGHSNTEEQPLSIYLSELGFTSVEPLFSPPPPPGGR